MTILFKQIKKEDFADIYNQFMIHDFPENELKTLETILTAYDQEKYACFIMEEASEIKAYACFSWYSEEIKILDYFAVTSHLRGSGYGSKMLAWIKNNDMISELLIESEDPDFADSQKELIIRQRRIAFYEKNGFVRRKTNMKLSDVEFALFTFEASVLSEESLIKEISQIYHHITPNLSIESY
ncbi:GNAT family N-acetyltransferase [Vagococcus hydrophili]|uniref:GNAT family N-acetyltransferase n=1 Tax=Vagococcus hydrophili TaxID=2714947 RepID=A0A6G8AWI7_9ENTE|nr:GNAT family N-acetyltransferase [Vagococcus hydrophili]QIL49377.1 GNAT family N-acetyltransferase [Vagococcus hydrophili]